MYYLHSIGVARAYSIHLNNLTTASIARSQTSYKCFIFEKMFLQILCILKKLED